MNTTELESLIRTILTEQLMPDAAPDHAACAIFAGVDEAINAAHGAFLRYQQSPLKTRSTIISALREQLQPHLATLSEEGARETGMGNKEDKLLKNKAALDNTPGIEDLTTTALTGDGGMVLFEFSPFGVIGSVAPSTNPTETIINNSISMLAAGNAVYFSPHPGAKNVSLKLIALIEEIVFNSCGIRNLVVTVGEPSVEATQQMMANEKIALLAITGGPAIVAMAMKSGKKTIGAGAGNPPCLVDETAELVKAAQDIVSGASFDYNLPCIAEKSLIVVDSVADRLLQQMQAFDALLITSPQDIDSLRQTCLSPQGHANKQLVGKSPAQLLQAAGLPCPAKPPRLLLVEVKGDDPLVTNEQLMPLLPVVRVKDFDAALELALQVEGGLHHTAIMHSQNVSRLNLAARRLQTSIFVKNGPSYAGIGVGGEGFTTFTIATPTGEGTTSARTFARQRRCVLTTGFSIR
ncbi:MULTISPECIES: aldehyde dehydrogenase family protein [unclassified Brenneria]|uniref:aldehyde dehydrogenase family protein n=1 Tax=unclassified Brenneria TaxID=2634434 RepID=UPI0018F05BC9|nr:aldehyde dehydrogenase family protein [Brenneria sp. L3-3C-1]MBJ7221576.1 aldehyde dehydrogenase EutE [Brenneria sp. L3-3C-1]MEE3642818.1 aldehyde dehydrogenase family protein [Brenneria sp. L3_3C_1]